MSISERIFITLLCFFAIIAFFASVALVICDTFFPPHCDNCGVECPGEHYCKECGYAIAPVCANCGEDLQKDQKYCTNCGAVCTEVTA